MSEQKPPPSDSSPVPGAPAASVASAPAAQPTDLAKVIHELKDLQNELTVQVNAIQDKVHKLELAFHENDTLRKEIVVLMEQVKSHEAEDWKRKNEFFPDIYLGYVTKITEKLSKK